MFTHIVLYKLNDSSEEAKNELRLKFMSMKGKVKQILEIECGCDVLFSERSYDVSLFIRFKSKEDFIKYKEDEYHKSVAKYVHSVKKYSVSVDYES